MTTTAPWPPPPDLESIRDLMRAADPEGHIADGSPADEYEPEEEQLFAAIRHFHILRLFDAQRELRQPASAEPIVDVRPDRVLLKLLSPANHPG